jgi:CHC2 zinc finger
VRCIFHSPDRDPSLAVNLATGAFHCFACGEHGGDVVDFVMLRDGLSFKDAAKSLGAWDGSLQTNAVVIRSVEAERARREQERQADAELEHSYFAEESWLYGIEEIYRNSNARLSELRRGAAEAFPGEAETHWDILALAQDDVREAAENFVRLRLAWPGAPHNHVAKAWRDSQI